MTELVIGNRKAFVFKGKFSREYPVQKLPDQFVAWQINTKKRLIEMTKESRNDALTLDLIHMISMSAHIATFVTSNPSGRFPVTLSFKRVMLLPKKKYLEEVIHWQEKLLASMYRFDWNESESITHLEKRADSVSEERTKFFEYLYDEERIDFSALGILEIFQGRTLKNITEKPECAIQFLSAYNTYNMLGDEIQAFQINCIAEIVEKGPFLEYLKNMKLLSDFYDTSFRQGRCEKGYICHVCEVYNKTPSPRLAGKRLV